MNLHTEDAEVILYLSARLAPEQRRRVERDDLAAEMAAASAAKNAEIAAQLYQSVLY